MKKVLYVLFLPYIIMWKTITKCLFIGHNWENHETTNTKILKNFIYTKQSKVLKGILKYRVCKTCGKQQKSESYFNSNTNWVDISEKPKEIKTYLQKVNLNSEDIKELEEYLQHFRN